MDASPNEFSWFPGVGKGIHAVLDDNGVVTFAIEAGEGSPIRGTAMFNDMMDAFGDRVVAVEGYWVKGAPERPSTNIDKVNELTAAGMSLEDALHLAWTATRAKKRGFGKISLLSSPQGLPGAYTKINVIIEK